MARKFTGADGATHVWEPGSAMSAYGWMGTQVDAYTSGLGCVAWVRLPDGMGRTGSAATRSSAVLAAWDRLTAARAYRAAWDRGLGESGDVLTDAAHSMGDSTLYFGDDGRVHLS